MTPPTPPATILLVDDNKDLLVVYADSLRPHFQSDQAGSVKEAEALLKARKYKVILSDHNMPGGDGLSFLARVRKEYPDTVRLLVTSHMDPKLMDKLSQAEPYRYLLKPVSIVQLLKTVTEAAKHHDQGVPGA